MLRSNGFAADEAATAPEAVSLTETGEYDFILLDYYMPGHDGLWFMRNVSKPPQTKVILMTAQNSLYIATAIIQCGGDGYIIKPFDEEQLLQHLMFYAHSSDRTEPA